MKKHRTLKLVLCLCIVASMFAVTAFAQKLEWTFNLNGGAVASYSPENPKNDNEQKAYINVLSLTTKGVTYVQVTDSSYNPYTDSRSVTGTGQFTLAYTKYAPANKFMRIKAWSTQSGTLKVRWNS